jgi:cellobiose phosphorylase
MTDDLLWLAFVTASYIRETGKFDVLQDTARFIDDEQDQPVFEHVRRAFARVFGRMSARGLPYIGAGDWNDGLSAAGLQERGESVWLGHFLAGLLGDWAEICRRIREDALAEEYAQRREALVKAINAHGWDGAWYMRGTLDDGSKLGSSESRVGRIFLNAQTWAILHDVAPQTRAEQCLAAVKHHLVSDAGALLLAPAYDEPDERVGYITRYAAGLRENGGVYTHAATWAIAAACKMGDRGLVQRLLEAINPANKDPDAYWAEPYVTPGNVDGPDSPHHGRGGWTWYTGSAAWLHRVISEWVLGVRPEWDGVRFAPCLPAGWTEAHMLRPYRGGTLDIDIACADGGAVGVTLDGKPIEGTLIPADALAGGMHHIRVRC